VKVLSSNIRFAGANDGENRWDLRKGACLDVLRSREPDIICFQEMWHAQRLEVQAALPDYEWFGTVDEPAGRNPMNAIFTRRAAFERISSGGYWLSNTPHIPGSTSWDSACIRLANWVRLLHVGTHKELRVLNTHLDHVSQPARENGARLIDEDAAAYPEAYAQVLTGDMNSDSSNPVIEIFRKHGWLDTYAAVHGDADPGFTFHEFRGPAYVSPIGKIDWIFVRGNLQVVGAEILRDCPNGRYPSDHYFILADVR
jgi:endonuclease/exonuclease/phosphatase family metal-dependent hydrolase